MYRTLLVPTDGSPRALMALKAAVRLARAGDARLFVLHVRPRYMPSAAAPRGASAMPGKREFDRLAARASARILDAARSYARARGVRCRAVIEPAQSVPRGIVRIARRVRADLVVMASHGRGRVASALLGSTTQQVLASCRIPVLVHR